MAKGAAGGDVDEEEGEAGAGDGVPAKFGRGGFGIGSEFFKQVPDLRIAIIGVWY